MVAICTYVKPFPEAVGTIALLPILVAIAAKTSLLAVGVMEAVA